MLIQISRRVILVLLLCVQFLYGQSQDTLQPSRPLPDADKALKSLQQYQDSINMANLQRGVENSVRFAQQYQKEQKRKQRQKAFMYIGFGVAMLGVLVYGMRRRKQQPKL